MADILEVVPVTDRTVRNWVSLGLIETPLLQSNGYKSGVIGLYNKESIEIGLLLCALRGLSPKQQLKILKTRQYRVNDDNTITLTVRAKTVWEKD